MASTTSSYLIGVKADLDATTFQTGAQQAEAAMTGMATTAQTAATDIDTALASDVPASADASALSLTTKATKFKAVGTELGTNLAQGLTSGLDAPEAAAQTASSMTGLLAASAETAKGALALVGLGIGVSMITNLIKGIQAKKQEVIDQFNSMFDSVEISAEDTSRQIRKSIFDAFDFQKIATELGSGDIHAGAQTIVDLAHATGLEYGQVAEVLQRGVTPVTKEWAQQLRDVSKETDGQAVKVNDEVVNYTDIAQQAQKLLGLAKANNVEQDKILTDKKVELGYLNQIADKSGSYARNMQAAAAAAAAAAASSQTIAAAIGRAASNSLGIDFSR